jgi:hypothetical protein
MKIYDLGKKPSWERYSSYHSFLFCI